MARRTRRRRPSWPPRRSRRRCPPASREPAARERPALLGSGVRRWAPAAGVARHACGKSVAGPRSSPMPPVRAAGDARAQKEWLVSQPEQYWKSDDAAEGREDDDLDDGDRGGRHGIRLIEAEEDDADADEE